ncbi:MAG: BrnT family toxin [Gemmatimonadetes bacterium]|jgi:uncharacterized DUF497 family protein|nr:BrnT family toxin [Gemmatimonadota bacterium]MBK9409973.1 BrnT family toxin [Gemmatimonadota bacterium]
MERPLQKPALCRRSRLDALYIHLSLPPVTFDSDPAKNAENVARRGFDFAVLVFAGTYVECDDTRRDYGEHRVIALGVADGLPLTVVFPDRLIADGGLVRRVISARISSRKERRRYAESLEAIRAQDDPDARPR